MAEAGDASAQFNLGMLYYEGNGVAQDFGKAAQWLGRAAKAEHHEALNFYGVLHATGKGVAQDFGKALELFRKADKCGYNCEPVYDDLPTDFRDKQYGMELVAAKRDFVRKARLLAAEARCNVGLAYHGEATDATSRKVARELFLSAATLGNGKAMHLLGTMCRDGAGVPASEVRAYMWFDLAVTAGFAKAGDARRELIDRMKDKDVARAEKLAARWLRCFPLPEGAAQ